MEYNPGTGGGPNWTILGDLANENEAPSGGCLLPIRRRYASTAGPKQRYSSARALNLEDPHKELR